LQFSNAPEITANNKSRFVKISQEEQPEQENQKPQLPNFNINEVVNNLVKAAQEAEANNLGEKEVAMSMAKVLRSYNDKLAPFKSQLKEQGINLNDIAPRR
jgi:predicted nucleic acid-binding protein